MDAHVPWSDWHLVPELPDRVRMYMMWLSRVEAHNFINDMIADVCPPANSEWKKNPENPENAAIYCVSMLAKGRQWFSGNWGKIYTCLLLYSGSDLSLKSLPWILLLCPPMHDLLTDKRAISAEVPKKDLSPRLIRVLTDFVSAVWLPRLEYIVAMTGNNWLWGAAGRPSYKIWWLN